MGILFKMLLTLLFLAPSVRLLQALCKTGVDREAVTLSLLRLRLLGGYVLYASTPHLS